MVAYTTVSIPSYPAAASATLMDMAKDQHNSLRRSSSNKDLCRNPKIRRSYSDNHLCHAVTAAGGVKATAAVEPKLKNSRSVGMILPFQLSNSLRSFLFDPETGKDIENLMEKEKEEQEVDIEEEDKSESDVGDDHVKRANWVERLMEINRHWRNRTAKENMDPVINDNIKDEYDKCDCDDEGDDVCKVDYEEEDEEEKEEEALDRDSFSKFLVRVPWSDTKLYFQLAFLSSMAYVIPQIKAKELRRYYGLQLVTSSLEKKAEVAKMRTKLDQDSTQSPPASSSSEEFSSQYNNSKERLKIQTYAAYEIAASAASYVQSRAKDLLSRGCVSQHELLHSEDSRRRGDNVEVGDVEEASSRVAAYVATSTMTAVVAAGERQKQEAAKDLQSLHSSPCEWFVCDDLSTYTRCFVIQGSDSLASWQANLLFEPTKFEDTNGLVHRGIYEAAKGIYEQFMPEIMEHMRKHGDRAKLQFTGHSLGGSLSLLVHLMLLTRKVVSPSTLRPVVTFGSPFVFCGGRNMLDELGLDENIIHSVMMHRDIVPRAFSCNYPNHVAVLLKRLNGSFRSHPCLLKNKLLYSPLGKMLILQPGEKTSPAHPLLPSGCALYALNDTRFGYSSKVLSEFLNQPHPLQTLSDPTAYGSEGTILRDHDSSNYLKALNAVLRHHTKVVVRRFRRQRIDHLWPLFTSPSPHAWSHEQSLHTHAFISNEIMSGV